MAWFISLNFPGDFHNVHWFRVVDLLGRSRLCSGVCDGPSGACPSGVSRGRDICSGHDRRFNAGLGCIGHHLHLRLPLGAERHAAGVESRVLTLDFKAGLFENRLVLSGNLWVGAFPVGLESLLLSLHRFGLLHLRLAILHLCPFKSANFGLYPQLLFCQPCVYKFILRQLPNLVGQRVQFVIRLVERTDFD